MAASKTTKKSPARSAGSNKKLITNNNGQRKKVMILSLLAFAIVGVVVIARSFAANTIISSTPAENLFVQRTAQNCTHDVRTSASKGNSKILRLSCTSAGDGTYIMAKDVRLGPGKYSVCTNTATTGSKVLAYKIGIASQGKSIYADDTVRPNSDGSAKWSTKCMPFEIGNEIRTVNGRVKFTGVGVLNVGAIYYIQR